MTATFQADELAEWSGGAWSAAPRGVLRGVSNDTRAIEQGNLYFALKGERYDGHEFVADAFRKGAGAAVVKKDFGFAAVSSASLDSQYAQPTPERPRGVHDAANRPLLRVDDPAKALRDIALSYRLKVNPEIVAVTGSVGKSTVKEMTARMLATTLPTSGTPGNWNNDIGLPLSILRMESDARAGVFEIGMNHPGEITALCGIAKPTCGVITNVGPVHLEFFDSVEAIAREKASLLRSLPSDGLAVLNRDGGFFDLLRAAAPCRVITVSMDGRADYTRVTGDAADNRVIIRETAGGDEFSLDLPVPGRFNAANAMLAVAVARAHGVRWDGIRDALRRYVGLPMRWEETSVAGRRVINDAYNANPVSMRASIQTFGEQTIEGRKWLALGGMLELGRNEEAEHLALGKFIGGGQWAGLITVGKLGDIIAQGAENAGLGKPRVYRCADKHRASQILAEKTSEGDAVLVKASRGIRLEEVIKEWITIPQGVPCSTTCIC